MTEDKPFLTTREIITVAILASLGGALSTFVGYLGNLVNLALGVPFGAGQFMAGLHVFWLVLIRLLVPKRGVATAGGLLKGLIELFTGSTHGVVIVIVSLIQGAIVDTGTFFGSDSEEAGLGTRLVWWVTAGVASASNVFVFYALFLTGTPFPIILTIIILAFCSGVIFAGYFAWETLDFLNEAGYTTMTIQETHQQITPRRRIILRNVPAVIFILFLVVGSLTYVLVIARPLANPNSCSVVGMVEQPYTYNPTAFSQHMITIEAELVGVSTYIPLTNYTGVLLSVILSEAIPTSEASGLRVIARDGYTITFELTVVMTDNELILSHNNDGLWLIASNYEGLLWVRSVVQLEVY